MRIAQSEGVLVLKESDYLTSDIQLFDEGLVKWRWAKDLEHLHGRTADDWDSAVENEATVLIIGDAIAYRVQEGLEWFSRRPGKKILITGNWDEINPLSEKNPKVDLEGWSEVFPEIYDRASVQIGEAQFLASHYTYSNTKSNPRLVELRAGWKDTGIPLLHGHTHSRKRST